MQIIRTIPLIIAKDQDLLDLVESYNTYQKAISVVAFNDGKPLRPIDLQHTVYHFVETELGAQMKCSAIRSVAAAYAAAKANGHPATHPIQFKQASAMFLFNKDFSFTRHGLLSISTTVGRKKIEFRVPDYARSDFDNAIARTAIVVQSTGRATLCVTLKVPDPIGLVPVGVDLGCNTAIVATTPTKTLIISGSKNRIRNDRTRKLRKRLQSKLSVRKAQQKDTHSVRKLLKRLGRASHNRNVTFAKEAASRFCAWAPPNAVLVFEDLAGLQRSVSKGKHKRRKGTTRKLSSFNHAEIARRCESAAERRGLAMTQVDPSYTSQRCRMCGSLGNRFGHRFTCACGHAEHADVNASHNIRTLYTILRGSGCPSERPEVLPTQG